MEKQNSLTNEQLDDLNSCLNVLLESIKNDTSEFPPLDLLEEMKQCLECLSNAAPLQERTQRAKFVSLSWPANLRIILSRLFRTFKIPEEYIDASFELANFAAQALGAEWLKSDSQFLRLLSSLSNGQLRIVLGKPTEINMAQLVACLQLQEFFLKCVEDEQEWMDDDDATFVGKCCQEAATFLCEYMIESAKQQVNINLQMELFLVLYRFICSFLAVGGAEIVDKKLLDDVLPILIKVCRYCISQRDDETVWFLLTSIAQFDQLPEETLALLMDQTALVYPAPAKRKEALIRLTSILEELKDRRGWFIPQALENAENLAKISGDRRLAELAVHIRGRLAQKEEGKAH